MTIFCAVVFDEILQLILSKFTRYLWFVNYFKQKQFDKIGQNIPYGQNLEKQSKIFFWKTLDIM